MRIIALFLLILFSCNSPAKPAWEIPYDQQKWNWFWFGAAVQNKDLAHNVDFTKLEKLPDGKVIYPYRVANTKEFIGPVEWVRADCRTKKVEGMGFFMDNTFSLASNPANYPPESLGYRSMLMLCGMESNQSGVIFGIGGYRVSLDDWIYPVGVMHKDIKINSSDPTLIDLIIYAYNASDGSIFRASNYQADCKNKTLKTSMPELIHKDSQEYAFQFICKYAEENLRGVKNKSTPPINNYSIDKKSLTSIDEAKDKCKTLGFKPGTEKFGTCVLELTK